MRKILLAVITVMTLGTAVLLSTKFGHEKPILNQPMLKVEDGKGSPLPKDNIQKEATFEEALASINEADLKKDLYYLAGTELEGRMSGKNGNKIAADWIKTRYESFGLPTMLHKFPMGRYNPGPKNETGDDFSSNIYAWIEGSDQVLKNEIVVVGAHADHIGYGPRGSQAPNRTGQIHPGADDNGSGTVALLGIARAFSMMKDKVKRTTVFMSFSGEEMGLIGSQYYCKNPVFPKGNPSMNKHVAMINMDMIGRLKDASAQKVIFCDGSDTIQDICKKLSVKYSFADRITGRGAGGSDHAPFYNKGVPVVCLHTGMHKEYHTPDDKPETINYRGLTHISHYVFELCWKVANSDTVPSFNYGKFSPMNCDRDHGEGVIWRTR